MTKKFRHCDEIADDPATPECLRRVINFYRQPAHGDLSDEKPPLCYATFKGDRVRIVFASAMGDVGITRDLSVRQTSYTYRVNVDELKDFKDTP